MSEDNQEEEKPIEDSKNNQIIELLAGVLKDVNLNEAISSFNNVKLEQIKSEEKKKLETLKVQNEANNSNIKFWKTKFIKESIVVAIILLTICYLAYLEKVDACTVGTLLGSIIGYAIGNFNSSNKEH